MCGETEKVCLPTRPWVKKTPNEGNIWPVESCLEAVFQFANLFLPCLSQSQSSQKKARRMLAGWCGVSVSGSIAFRLRLMMFDFDSHAISETRKNRDLVALAEPPRAPIRWQQQHLLYVCLVSSLFEFEKSTLNRRESALAGRNRCYIIGILDTGPEGGGDMVWV